MRPIKFEYVARNLKFNEIHRDAYALDEISRGTIGSFYLSGNDNCEILARRQFTGLQDRNGKDIYEGDIVRLYQFSTAKYYPTAVTRVVSWRESTTHIGWNIGKGKGQMRWEVVGNVYETPELAPNGKAEARA